MVAKAEHSGDKSNPRFIVTSLSTRQLTTRALYKDFYCARGEAENRIKECQLDLFADRLSTKTLRGNQLRPWWASAAYVLMHALRRVGLAGTAIARSRRHYALATTEDWRRGDSQRAAGQACDE